jgi:hypothetical protein
VTFRPFPEARKHVRKLGLKSQSQWHQYCKSGNKPEDIPSYPEAAYENDWIGYGDWLGTGTIAPKDRNYRPFENAKKFVRSLNLKSSHEWKEYCKSGKKPADIPANPLEVYGKEWKGFGDWLGR